MGISILGLGASRGARDAFFEEAIDDVLRSNSRGDKLIIKALPETAEVCKHGHTYITCVDGATSQTAVPTTTASFSLWNGEPQAPHGKTYIIHYVGVRLASALAATVVLTVFAQVCITPASVSATNMTYANMRGALRPYRGLGKIRTNVSVTADAWHNVVSSIVSENAAANIGLTVGKDVGGRYMVPPNGIFSMCPCVSTGVVTGGLILIWSEVNTGSQR